MAERNELAIFALGATQEHTASAFLDALPRAMTN